MALLNNLVTSLLWHGKVETTVTRAKEARSLAEKLITLGKQDTLHRRREARRTLMPRTSLIRMSKGSYREAPATGEVEKELQAGRRASTVENSVTHLFEHVAPQYQDRPGGYSRIIRIGPRRGDGTEMALLQLVDYKAPEPAK
jgi:large subunit ribosomal protein L17